MDIPRRFKLIACEIMLRELAHCAAVSPNIVDFTFLPKGLHDMGEQKMSALLQAAIDEVDPSRYEAILLGYGLCNNGIRGLHAPVPMVIPRAHDCIALLLGSRQKYAAYFDAHPGTYYKSPGWVERSQDPGDDHSTVAPGSVMAQLGINRTYEQYVAKFGEDNARYLMEMLGNWVKNYTRLAYIDTGVGDFARYKEQTRAEAECRSWDYEELQGSTALLQLLLDGDWDAADFLVIPPNQTVEPTYDDDIIRLS
jgi:hypothetical protein